LKRKARPDRRSGHALLFLQPHVAQPRTARIHRPLRQRRLLRRQPPLRLQPPHGKEPAPRRPQRRQTLLRNTQGSGRTVPPFVPTKQANAEAKTKSAPASANSKRRGNGPSTSSRATPPAKRISKSSIPRAKCSTWADTAPSASSKTAPPPTTQKLTILPAPSTHSRPPAAGTGRFSSTSSTKQSPSSTTWRPASSLTGGCENWVYCV